MSYEIKFTYVTGRTLTYTVRKPDGTLRGPANRPLTETSPTSGYYTNKDRPDLVASDMVIIKDSETGQNVGSGEWKPEDVAPVKCWGIKRMPGWIFKKTSNFILTVIVTILATVIAAIVVDIFADFGWLQSIKAFVYSIFGPK